MVEALARVNSVVITYSHGCLTAWVDLQLSKASFQGFGGYAFDQYNRDTDEREFPNGLGLAFISAVMEICDSETWDGCVDKPVIALKDAEMGSVVGLKAMPFVSDKQFRLDELAKEYINEL